MTRRPGSFRCPFPSAWARVVVGAVAGALAGLLAVTAALAAPRVVIISLDGATPRFVDQYLGSGASHKGRLRDREGLGEEEAYRRLRTTAMNTRRPIVEVALEVLGAGEGRAVGGAVSGLTEPARSVERHVPRRRPGLAWSPRSRGRFVDAAAP